MGVVVLPSLLSLLLVIAAAGAAGAAGPEAEAVIRPAAAGEVLGETLCCSNKTEYRKCVHDCLVLLPDDDKKYCEGGCQEAYQCKPASGDGCPGGHPSSSSTDVLADSAVGEVVVVVQAEAVVESLCCSNNTEYRECVHDCLVLLPDEDKKYCEGGCQEAYQCHAKRADEECPSGQRSSSPLLITDSSLANDGNAVDYCILGCKSSVCNKMATGVGRKGVVKHALERCNNACSKLCTKGGATGTSTA